MILAEAMAWGRPVIVTSQPPLLEIINRDQAGLAVPPGDERALGEALKHVLTDDGLADRLGANARNKYLLDYGAERNFQSLMSVYQRAMEVRASRAPSEAGRLKLKVWEGFCSSGTSSR